jgi:aryl-alcohol dehydrogenase-like predicted oxidoreductase
MTITPLPQQITIGTHSKHPIIVNRLGYGTMRLTGEGIYGEPANRPEALAILKEAVDSGIRFFDTADYYGEDVTNRLIKEALYPYPPDILICTKVGATRMPDKSWVPFNSPDNIRTAIENNLRTLQLEQISLVHCRVMPVSDMPFEKSLEALFQLQQEGKVLHVGISNVTREQMKTALQMGAIATVENMYGHGQRTTLKSPHGENRGGEELLDLCENNQIPLIPYFSLVNALPKQNNHIQAIADKYQATVAQVNIAWLLHRSPWILPIPGTSSLAHFRENMKAVALKLTHEEMSLLE